MRLNFQPSPAHLTESEARRLVRPAGISIFILALFLVGDGITQNMLGNASGQKSTLYGVIIFLMNAVFYFIILRNPPAFNKFQNLFAVLDGSILGVGLWLVPEKNDLVVYMVLLLISLIFVILWERLAAFVFILVAAGLSVLVMAVEQEFTLRILWGRVTFVIMAFVLVETVSLLMRTMRLRIKRLEIINEFARKIGTSLEAEQVVNIVNAALQKAINADRLLPGDF